MTSTLPTTREESGVPAPSRLALLVERSAAAGRLADRLEPVGRPLRSGAAGGLLRDRLLGHALHPLLTDVVITAWTAAAVLDARRRPAERDAARLFEGLGILASLPTATTGVAEWALTGGRERRVGAAHAALNGVALLLHVGSWGARRAGRHGLGATTGLLGTSVGGVSALLGGHLTTVRKVGSERVRGDES